MQAENFAENQERFREKKPLLYVNDGVCRPGKPDCEATEVLYNFVAWSSRNDRDLAIINIVEYTDV